MKQAIGFLQYSSEYICFSAISESDKEKLLEEGTLTPIKDITALIGLFEQNENEMLELKIPKE